jgi:hypothetical protein
MSVEIRGLDVVLGNLERLGSDFVRKRHDAADEIGHLLADYAKAHHKWGNPYSAGYEPTGATDTSTKGDIVEETTEYVMVALSAGMDYDVFLELARRGRWAWLAPAVEANRERMMEIMVKRLSV